MAALDGIAILEDHELVKPHGFCVNYFLRGKSKIVDVDTVENPLDRDYLNANWSSQANNLYFLCATFAITVN